MNKAVFLDRDGVITREPPYYAHRLDQLALIPRAGDAVRRLNENGFITIIISNQSGIGRGYYSEQDTDIFNRAMKEELSAGGARIDAIYICPHHPEASIGSYRVDCDCRKPRPGLLLKAGNELDIDMPKSFMVGDKLTDVEAGRRAGVSTVLVKTGQGKEELKNGDIKCDFITDDLYTAVEYILEAERDRKTHDGAPAQRAG